MTGSVLLSCSRRPARATWTTPASLTQWSGQCRPRVRRLPANQPTSRLSSASSLSSLPLSPRSRTRRDPTGTANAGGGASGDVPATAPTIWTIPTILTLLRVVAIPLLVAAWFSGARVWCFSLFVGASVTDFFDGYLARKWDCSTPFGAFLDPVADKLMVATILILIGTVPVPAGCFAGNAWLLPAIACVIIAREITMSALREWAAALGPEAHAAAAVNKLGKYKTTSQMVSLVLLLGAKTGACGWGRRVACCV